MTMPTTGDSADGSEDEDEDEDESANGSADVVIL
jgi:hypothetical protein